MNGPVGKPKLMGTQSDVAIRLSLYWEGSDKLLHQQTEENDNETSNIS